MGSCGVSDGCTVQMTSRLRSAEVRKNKKSRAEKKRDRSTKMPEPPQGQDARGKHKDEKSKSGTETSRKVQEVRTAAGTAGSESDGGPAIQEEGRSDSAAGCNQKGIGRSSRSCPKELASEVEHMMQCHLTSAHEFSGLD